MRGRTTGEQAPARLGLHTDRKTQGSARGGTALSGTLPAVTQRRARLRPYTAANKRLGHTDATEVNPAPLLPGAHKQNAFAGPQANVQWQATGSGNGERLIAQTQQKPAAASADAALPTKPNGQRRRKSGERLSTCPHRI